MGVDKSVVCHLRDSLHVGGIGLGSEVGTVEPPESLRVLGETLQVIWGAKQKEYGLYDEAHRQVRMTPGSGRFLARVLLHEYAEALFIETRDPDKKITREDFARLFELGVADLIRNNPEALSWAVSVL